MDNLVSQGKEICNIIGQLLDLGEEFEIHKTMLYCKYLEESKHYID